MQVIGFNFTKIMAERPTESVRGATINTNIEFANIENENLPLLKDQSALKITFKFSVNYIDAGQKKETSLGNILFEGVILIATPPAVAKELLKNWKKKELTHAAQLPLFNLILRRCTLKALDLEDQVGLPTHIPLPHLSPKTDEG